MPGAGVGVDAGRGCRARVWEWMPGAEPGAGADPGADMHGLPLDVDFRDRGRARMWCMRRLPRSREIASNGRLCMLPLWDVAHHRHAPWVPLAGAARVSS